MKICLFAPSFLPELGGMEVVIDRLARQLMVYGHEPVVIAQQPRRPAAPVELPYEVIYYPRPRSAVWLLGGMERLLLEEHGRRHFDVIHSHMAYPTGYVAAKLRQRLGAPVVITSHNGDIRPGSRYRRRFITRWRMCWAMRKVDAVTGVSARLKDIIDELTCNKANSSFIPNGVDIPDTTPGSMPASCVPLGDRPFMLALGRLHRYKGLDVLLDAMSLIGCGGASVQHLVIAGDGVEMDNLRRQAVDLHIEDKVIMAGPVFGPEKHWLLRNCAFFLQPSRSEGMPLTVLEAMSYGKAVIGTRITGISELVRQGQTGYIVEPEDSRSLAEAIRQASGNTALSRMGVQAAEIISTMTWSVVAGRYIELYERLIYQSRQFSVTS
jgi:teichuronic acid biosynthesis glycosyltransferase TuaC